MTLTFRRALSIWMIAGLFVLALLPVPSVAQVATPGAAPEPPSFLLEPVGQDGSYFTLTMEPGSSKELTVALGNAGKSPVAALTYVSDAYSLVNGGFGVKTADDPPTGPTTWIDYPSETIDLAPGDRTERTFTVSVPADAAPGQYISGLSIQTADSIAVGDSNMLRQIIKKSVAVFIVVPGPEAPSLEIGEARLDQTGPASTLSVDIRNTGNVFLNPEGTVEVTTADGKPVLSSPVRMGTVYAGDETTLELSIPTTLPGGDYSVSVSLGDTEHGVKGEKRSMAVHVEAESATASVVAPVTMASASIEPISAGNALQAVNVNVAIDNTGAAIPSARLTMHVTRDGTFVEDYPLNSSLVVQSGTTAIQQRYIPLKGWESGTYSFSLTLEAVDPASGQVTVLATKDIEDTVTVP